VLRARPKPRTPKPCEPLPVGVDHVAASARRRSKVRRRSTRTSAHGTPRRSPPCSRYAPLPARRRALRRTRSAGLRCGAARCARRHRRCARACAHVSALACTGPWVFLHDGALGVLACACDHVRAPTMRVCAACVRVRRALFVRPSIDETHTGIVYRYVLHIMYLHPCARLATQTNG
jgi:hypothetical protein